MKYNTTLITRGYYGVPKVITHLDNLYPLVVKIQKEGNLCIYIRK